MKRVEKTGNCRPKAAKNKGTPPKIKELQKFRDFVLKHQEKTQKQIAELWGERLTQQNVSNACQKLGMTRKKTYRYRERNEEQRAEFIERLKAINIKKLIYVDEAGFDEREDYPWGYSPKGQKCYAFKSGKRSQRISWISALREKRLLAPFTFEGACNREIFLPWMRESTLPHPRKGT